MNEPLTLTAKMQYWGWMLSLLATLLTIGWMCYNIAQVLKEKSVHANSS